MGHAGSRFATTVPINTSGGGQIGFCIRLANGPAWPWAQVDNLPAEGVVLECSTNGGGSWTAIGNYDTPAYYNWTGVALPIPAVAQAPAALFRWRQLSNSGTNYDHWALDNVVIGTGSMAPKIVMDPQSQNVAVGDPASLSVAAVGTPPLSYQWLLNGTNINGATASSLVWTNIQLTDAGTYSVLVSNSVGTAMSSNAVLTVYVPVCAPPPPGLVSWWRAEGDASRCLWGQQRGAGKRSWLCQRAKWARRSASTAPRSMLDIAYSQDADGVRTTRLRLGQAAGAGQRRRINQDCDYWRRPMAMAIGCAPGNLGGQHCV